ncbi:hypothetical protein JOM56_011461 [Amanita muscaria]
MSCLYFGQPCYCGEPNCIRFVGGKAQTDIAAIDDLCFDCIKIAGYRSSSSSAALGTDEADIFELKGTKKKKGKKINDRFRALTEDSKVIVHVQGFSGLEENEDNIKIRTLAQ